MEISEAKKAALDIYEEAQNSTFTSESAQVVTRNATAIYCVGMIIDAIKEVMKK